MNDESLDPAVVEDVSAWARGGAAGLIGVSIGSALLIAWQLALARLLGAAGLGTFSLASSILLVLTTLVPLGLDHSALRYVAFHRARKEVARTLGVIRFATIVSTSVAVIVAALVAWQSGWLALRLFDDPALHRVLSILLLGLPCAVLVQVLGAVMQGFQRIGIRVLTQNILVPAGRLLGIIVLLVLWGSVSPVSVAAVATAATAVGALTLAIITLQNVRALAARVGGPLPPTEGLFGYSGRAFLSAVLEQLSVASPVILLALMGTSAQVGIFGAAFRAALMLGLIATGLSMIAAPAISARYAIRDLAGLRTLYALITRWGTTLAMPLFLLIVVLASDVMRAFGADFVGGAVALQLLAIGQLLNLLTGPCRQLLKLTDHQRLDLLNGLLGLGAGTIVGVLVIPEYGVTGAALGAATNLAIINVLGLIQSRRAFNVQPYGRAFAKPVLASLLAAATGLGLQCLISYPADWIRIMAVLAGMLLAYIAVLPILRLEPEDRRALRKLTLRHPSSLT